MENELHPDIPLNSDVDGPTPKDCAIGKLEGLIRQRSTDANAAIPKPPLSGR